MAFFLFFAGSGTTLNAQPDRVVTVPYDPSDPSVPFPAIYGYPITMKAMVRNTAGTSYTISWDFDGDGAWDYSFNKSPNSSTQSIPDIGATWTPPYSSTNKLYASNVRVQNNSNGNITYGSVYTYVYNWTPHPNPMSWTDEQVNILQEIALHENLWYLHKQISGSGYGNSQIYGLVSSSVWTTVNLLELFTANGRFPAYPPGTVNFYGLPQPTGWATYNDFRWNSDPYAEDALRIMNYLFLNAGTTPIAAGSEENTCGYDIAGNQLYCSRIAGTANNTGLIFNTSTFTHGDGGNPDCFAQILSGLSRSLFVHAGVPVQAGSSAIQGKTLEYLVQELVDYLVHHQIDGGGGQGGFHYNPVNGNIENSVAEATVGVARGLYDAELYGSPYGVIVNNKVKYRLAQNIVNQQGANGLAIRIRSGSSVNNNFNYTGGYIGICRWLGIDKFMLGDNTVPFTGYSTYTKGQLRQAYDSYINASGTLWNSATKIDDYNWLDHFWQNGDYLSGDITSTNIYNKTLGSTFNMFFWATGLYMEDHPPESFAGHNWKRQLAIHLIRGQSRNSPSNPDGSFRDSYCPSSYSITCSLQYPFWSSVLAGRILSKFSDYRLTFQWTGNVNSDWSQTGNWHPSKTPDASTNASIFSAFNYPVIGNGTNAMVHDLTINLPAGITKLTINPGGTLTVIGTLNNLTGTDGLLIKSDALNTGSLITDNGADASIERYLTHSKWHLIGMPVESGVAGIFDLPVNHSDIYLKAFVEATNDWGPDIVSITEPLAKGKGYICWVGDPLGLSQDETVVFPGKVNAGDYTTGQNNFCGLEYSGSGYNLICNPYPSAMLANIHQWSRLNVDASVWVWDPGLNTPSPGGNYRFWNGTMGNLTNGIIPAMQGFFVHTSNTGASLTIPQENRVHNNQPFYKSTEIPVNTIQLNVTGNGYADDLFVSFKEQATEYYDPELDVAKIYGLPEAPQLFSIIPDNKLSINTLPDITDNRMVEIGFGCTEEASFTISATGLDGFSDDVNIYLKDLKTGISQNLKEFPGYTFNHSPDYNTSRFILYFSNPISVAENAAADFIIYTINKDVCIINPEMLSGDVSIYDLTGRLIKKTEISRETVSNIKMNTVSGLFLVHVMVTDRHQTQIVFIK